MRITLKYVSQMDVHICMLVMNSFERAQRQEQQSKGAMDFCLGRAPGSGAGSTASSHERQRVVKTGLCGGQEVIVWKLGRRRRRMGLEGRELRTEAWRRI